MWIFGLMKPSGLHLQWIFIPHEVLFSSGHMQLWTHESLDIGHFERTIVWSGMHANFFLQSWSDYRLFKTAYVQIVVRSRLPMIRLSCVQSCICTDYCAFKVTYVQTIVRSKLLMSRISCVQNCRCPDYRAFKIAYVQTIVRSKLLMSRLSFVQNCICPDYRAFKITYVQTIVRSKLLVQTIVRSFFFRPWNFERTTPPCSFRSGHINFWSGTSNWE